MLQTKSDLGQTKPLNKEENSCFKERNFMERAYPDSLGDLLSLIHDQLAAAKRQKDIGCRFCIANHLAGTTDILHSLYFHIHSPELR